jgi:hypothetical protein
MIKCSTVQLSNLPLEYHESHLTLSAKIILTPGVFEAHRNVLVNAPLLLADGALR